MKQTNQKLINQIITDQQHILKLLTFSNQDERQEIKDSILELKTLKKIKKYSELKNKRQALKEFNELLANSTDKEFTAQQIKEIKRQDYFLREIQHGTGRDETTTIKTYPVLINNDYSFIDVRFTGNTQTGTPQELAEQNTFKNWILQGKDPVNYFFN